ncbi:MAG: peptide-methionine (S)-S-oxide reductase [Candidatus Melainabacteria bacterium HGW-Melainabacteria-1]|nr:MAG: peptide-methionine (S)-S-oxide reductase [Candidatus Melainabacteria bacterium HGW-Melainabacteria-1]
MLAGVYYGPKIEASNSLPLAPPTDTRYRIATFAGGCFWCMEPPFDKLDGVLSTTSGYTGGQTKNPTYQQVTSGNTGHTEAVRIVYDPNRVSYQKLLDVFWRQINPTTPDRQFVDVGSQYRTGIYYHSEEQKQLALKSRATLDKSKRFGAPIVTEIKPAGPFWPAEDYHQNYYKTHPTKYQFYRWNSGRDQYLDKIWGAGKH